MVSLYWSVSVYNQVTIQPQQYLVLGQIKQNYLVEKINLLNHQVLNSFLISSLLTHISNVKRWEEQDKVIWAVLSKHSRRRCRTENFQFKYKDTQQCDCTKLDIHNQRKKLH